MIRSLYTSVSGLITLENKQATITNNMTNANTNGFKSDILTIKSFDDVMVQNMDKKVGNTNVKQNLGTLSLGAQIDTVENIYSQGILAKTDRPTDFAIDGRGFFTVQRETANGNQIMYTRDGQLKINREGYLVTNSGDKVLGVNRITGELEPIFVGDDSFRIDSFNNVIIQGASTHSLAMADFKDYSELRKVGSNYYLGEEPIFTNRVWVAQGYSESANVNISNEMVEMISTMRNFETNQKMVQTIDDTLGKAANEIGAVR